MRFIGRSQTPAKLSSSTRKEFSIFPSDELKEQFQFAGLTIEGLDRHIRQSNKYQRSYSCMKVSSISIYLFKVKCDVFMKDEM